MTTTPTPTDVAKKPRHIPGCWGTSAVAFYERHEDELVTAHFLDATCPPLSGRLVGVDQYDIFLEVAGDTVLVCKHAIRYLTPGAADRVCPCPPSPSRGTRRGGGPLGVTEVSPVADQSAQNAR